MKVDCTLEFFYEDEKKAQNVLKSVDVDNYGYVKAGVKENRLVSKIQAKSLQSLLHTLEDYLSCISIAERIAES
ncbi:MAG: KEOPS complex subunit Pcc1 [Thermoplasmata archaeon]